MAAANPLRLLWLRDIANSTGPRTVTTEGFLNSRNVTVNSASTNGEFSLYVGNPKRLTEFFSHEADRFASAAFESLLSEGSINGYGRSTAWLLIRGYYAAFFSMHSLLRIHGWACTRIVGDPVTSINAEINRLYPGSDRVQGGLYFLKVVGDGLEIHLQRLDSAAGGSHEALWSLLPLYLSEVTNIALADTTDPEASASLSVAIEEFRRFLSGKGGANWFTQVRNRLNYFHGYGAWFPYTRSTSDVQRIASGLSGWLMPPDEALQRTSNDELVQFSEACSFLVSLCRTTIEDLAFRATARSPFRSSSGRLVTQAKAATMA